MKKTNPKIKIIRLSKILKCHDDALSACLEAKAYTYQYEQLYLSRDLVSYLQAFDPLHVIQIPGKGFEFFAGWHWLSICRQLNINNIAVIIYSEIIKDELQKMAWSYLLANQLKSFHRHQNLAQLTHYLEVMPHHVRNNLLSLYGASSSQKIVQHLGNESRSAIRNQKKYLKSSEMINSSTPSIREQLIKGGAK